MSWFGPPEVGDHVRARRDLSAGWMDTLSGHASVRKGRTGIIRAADRGLFSSRYTVEFDDGFATRTVSDLRDGDLRRTGGHGDRQWQTKREIRRGLKLGLFCAFTLPALVSLAWYFLHGGTVAELIPALLDELLTMAFALVTWLLGALAPLLPLVMVGGILLFVVRGRRST